MISLWVMSTYLLIVFLTSVGVLSLLYVLVSLFVFLIKMYNK
jgi:hypothetical protein